MKKTHPPSLRGLGSNAAPQRDTCLRGAKPIVCFLRAHEGQPEGTLYRVGTWSTLSQHRELGVAREAAGKRRGGGGSREKNGGGRNEQREADKRNRRLSQDRAAKRASTLKGRRGAKQ